jgi:hypothetical protein
MDEQAKQHLRVAKRSPHHYYIVAGPWSIWTQGKKIIAYWTNTVYDLVHSEEAKAYWGKKDNQTTETMNTVHWTAIHKAMEASTRSRRVFVSKHVSGMYGVGKFMKRWNLRPDSA